MDLEVAREYFLNKPGVIEERPFRMPVPVFKVGGKMVGFINIHEPERSSITIKYYKNRIDELRFIFKEIKPGYHMNKDNWNTVYLDGSIPEDFIKELIDISYRLVFDSLTQKKQKEILGE